jgi:hypothetical protein
MADKRLLGGVAATGAGGGAGSRYVPTAREVTDASPEETMKKVLARAGAILMTGCAVAVATTGAANAAVPAASPPPTASCVGQVFVPQATGEPGTVARRITEIKRDILPEIRVTFGAAIRGLAKAPRANFGGD